MLQCMLGDSGVRVQSIWIVFPEWKVNQCRPNMAGTKPRAPISMTITQAGGSDYAEVRGQAR